MLHTHYCCILMYIVNDNNNFHVFLLTIWIFFCAVKLKNVLSFLIFFCVSSKIKKKCNHLFSLKVEGFLFHSPNKTSLNNAWIWRLKIGGVRPLWKKPLFPIHRLGEFFFFNLTHPGSKFWRKSFFSLKFTNFTRASCHFFFCFVNFTTFSQVSNRQGVWNSSGVGKNIEN